MCQAVFPLHMCTNIYSSEPYLFIILKIRKLRHQGLNALPKVKELVSGRVRSW